MKENLRKLLCMMLAVLLLVALAAPALAETTAAVGVKVSGKTVQWTDAEPFIDESRRTMVPLRAVAEALGLSVSWDGVKREAVFTDGKKTICFPIGSTEARTGDGGTVKMDTAAVIVNRRTFAPVRYLAEYFGYAVEWDGKTRTVMIQPGYRLASVINSATSRILVRFPDGSTEYYWPGTTKYLYNEEGLLQTALSEQIKIEYTYDEAGREINRIEDGSGYREYRSTYDQDGKHISLECWWKKGLDETTYYEYDDNGNLIREINHPRDGGDHETIYKYNDSRQLDRQISHSADSEYCGAWLYFYDEQERVSKVCERGGLKEGFENTDTEYQYGAEDAWICETYVYFGTAAPLTVQKALALNGNSIDSPPADATRRTTRWDYQYDSKGRLVSVKNSIDGTYQFIIRFKYEDVNPRPQEDEQAEEEWVRQYKNVLKNYTATYHSSSSWYYTDYTLYDINKDGIPELLVRPAERLGHVIDVYTYADSQAQLCGEISDIVGDQSLHEYPNGLLYTFWAGTMYGGNGYGHGIATLLDNKLVKTEYTALDKEYAEINKSAREHREIENFYFISDMRGFES